MERENNIDSINKEGTIRAVVRNSEGKLLRPDGKGNFVRPDKKRKAVSPVIKVSPEEIVRMMRNPNGMPPGATIDVLKE